jgi:hypothetical protein
MVQTSTETYVVGKWRKEPLEDLGDNIFANNPFLDDLLEWRHSPETEQFAELADALCDLMEDVQLDAKQRKFIRPDQSVQHIHRSTIPTSAVTGSRAIWTTLQNTTPSHN